MIEGKTVLGLIPARGGSKRIPGKNLRDLCGKPLIMWTVDAAKKSRILDKVVCTTDDRNIVKAVSNNGVEIVDRPPELAADESSIYDCIFHAIQFFEPHDYTVLLHPTSPLRLAKDIDGCIESCVIKNAPSCVTVSPDRPDANGAVYCAWTTWLMEMQMFDSGRVVTHTMPKERSVDVDNIDDFREAERLMAARA